MRFEFLRALRQELPAALHEIRAAGVGPTDIQQAAIGPGIGIFTRYAQVLNPDGSAMLVKDALKLINQVREEIGSDLDTDYDAETRFALDWFNAHGFSQGKAGDAITMTNAVNISLDGVKRAGFFIADGGIARLLKREELPSKYDPEQDSTPTVWEAVHVQYRVVVPPRQQAVYRNWLDGERYYKTMQGELHPGCAEIEYAVCFPLLRLETALRPVYNRIR